MQPNIIILIRIPNNQWIIDSLKGTSNSLCIIISLNYFLNMNVNFILVIWEI